MRRYNAFGKVDLPLAETPGAEGDAKLSGATFIHDFVEPVRWVTPTVLKIARHDCYQTTDKSGASRDSVRVYDITATIGVDAKTGSIANLWKKSAINEDRDSTYHGLNSRDEENKFAHLSHSLAFLPAEFRSRELSQWKFEARRTKSNCN